MNKINSINYLSRVKNYTSNYIGRLFNFKRALNVGGRVEGGLKEICGYWVFVLSIMAWGDNQVSYIKKENVYLPGGDEDKIGKLKEMKKLDIDICKEGFSQSDSYAFIMDWIEAVIGVSFLVFLYSAFTEQFSISAFLLMFVLSKAHMGLMDKKNYDKTGIEQQRVMTEMLEKKEEIKDEGNKSEKLYTPDNLDRLEEPKAVKIERPKYLYHK